MTIKVSLFMLWKCITDSLDIVHKGTHVDWRTGIGLQSYNWYYIFYWSAWCMSCQTVRSVARMNSLFQILPKKPAEVFCSENYNNFQRLSTQKLRYNGEGPTGWVGDFPLNLRQFYPQKALLRQFYIAKRPPELYKVWNITLWTWV